MKVKAWTGRDDLACVYIAENDDGNVIEFVESVQPPFPRVKKWVLMISTLCGCPYNCMFCDAGGSYRGRLSFEEMLFQIDFLVRKRFPSGKIPCAKFKIQFARMGEPSLNHEVITLLEKLPVLYDAPGLIPSVSTIAPSGAEDFFESLLEIKNKFYPADFQLQFSIHTTDEKIRNEITRAKKWSLEKIGEYGRIFYGGVGRKVTLNFAVTERFPVDTGILLKYFDKESFLVKITPVNPTFKAKENGILSDIRSDYSDSLIRALREAGYEVIVAAGEFRENLIGSNCGQYIENYRRSKGALKESYVYKVMNYEERLGI